MSPTDSFKVSEIFTSLQGEGPSSGTPAVFLRLALCNLHCHWCDTKYTWDFEHHDYSQEVHELSTPDLLQDLTRQLCALTALRLVITGGEPLLQQRALVGLLDTLPAAVFVEVETNGTIAPEPELGRRVDQWNVSPKLAHGGDPEERRIRLPSLAALRDTGRAWLKVVIGNQGDITEAEALIASLRWPELRVMLMPEASRAGDLRVRLPLLKDLATPRGWAVSGRLHIERWDGQRGL